MANPGKRSVEEAFEEVEQSEQRQGKRRRKRNKHRNSSRVTDETKDVPGIAKVDQDQNQEKQPDADDIAEHAQHNTEADAAPHGGKSKKKRRREWKEKHAQQTTPKKEVKAVGETVIEPTQGGLVSTSPTVNEPEHTKKKRRHKKRKSATKTDNPDAPSVEEDVADGESSDGGALLQVENTVGSTIGKYAVESAKQIKRKRQREKKKLHRQLRNQLEEGLDGPILNGVKGEELDEEPAHLEEQVDNRSAPKKRRKRYRPGRPAQIIKREEHEDSAVIDIDEEAPEVKSTPLEDRIEIPDELKSRRKKEMSGDASSADDLEDADEIAGDPIVKSKRSHWKHSRRRDSRDWERNKIWSISEGTGGIFIDQDPILTSDDQHLILSTRSEVRIYSRSTSLLIRSLKSEAVGRIVSCVLLSSNPSLLLVGTSTGIVSLWDWTDGTEMDAWTTTNGLKQIIPIGDESSLSILAIHEKDHLYTLKAFQLGTGTDEAIEVATLQERKHLGIAQFFQDAGVVVTFARKKLIIGHCRKFQATEIGGIAFSWYELKLPFVIASFDARVAAAVGNRKLPRIDLAVGLSGGDILTYEDVLFKIIGKQKNLDAEEVEPKRLSWHRNFVNTVKWSRDGNYLVSGGSETTLVIWQLDTNQQQYLPNLSSTVTRLAVSEKGSAYALRLADNSVMVLGTANLVPETNVTGVAAPATGQLIATLHPTASEKLLVVCPADPLLPLKNESHNTSLQTYDISADLQLGRQALTRNLTTVVNVDSDGRPLREPNVSHLKISADGKWMATIDEWRPSPHDLEALYLRDEAESVNEYSEVRLRIWSYHEDQGDWELVTRVDDPNSIARILSLQSNPVRAEFAAIGADGILRIWQPRSRVRDGVRVRDEQGNQLYTWMSVQAVNVPMHDRSEAKSAAMTYSVDGSTLVVSLELNLDGPQWIYLLDASSGEIVHSVPDLVTSGRRCIVSVGRHLALLSNTICVYDVITAQVMMRTELAGEFCAVGTEKFLAVNKVDGTVAIGLNKSSKHDGQLTILDVSKLEGGALLEEKVHGQIRAILATPSAAGFVIIDGHSLIKQVKPPGQSRALISTNTVESEEVARGLDRVFGQAVNGSTTTRDAKMLMNGDQDQVAGRTVEEALGFDSSAQAPTVDGLFERIAGVFARPLVAA